MPLHVLHAYDDDSSAESSSDSDSGKFNIMYSKSQRNDDTYYKQNKNPGRYVVLVLIFGWTLFFFKYRRGRPSGSGLSPSGDKLIKTMKRYLKAAGIKRVKFSKLWEGN